MLAALAAGLVTATGEERSGANEKLGVSYRVATSDGWIDGIHLVDRRSSEALALAPPLLVPPSNFGWRWAERRPTPDLPSVLQALGTEAYERRPQATDDNRVQRDSVLCGPKPCNPATVADWLRGYRAWHGRPEWEAVFIEQIIPCESSWWTNAVSPGQHRGLGQFDAGTWATAAAITGLWDWTNPFAQGANMAVTSSHPDINRGLQPWSCAA